MADVDVNNHPVPGPLIPRVDLMLQHEMRFLWVALSRRMGWHKGTTPAILNVELAEVGGTVYTLSCPAQVCCCRISRGTIVIQGNDEV